MSTDRAQFEITGEVGRRYVGQKFGKVTVLVTDDKGRKAYLEVVSFKPGEIGHLNEGDRITVKGRIGRRKLDGVQQPGRDGRMFDVYETQLIANYIAPEASQQQRIDRTPSRHQTRNVSEPAQPGDALDDDGIPF